MKSGVEPPHSKNYRPLRGVCSRRLSATAGDDFCSKELQLREAAEMLASELNPICVGEVA
jgi:hypothetical protein